MNSATLRKLGNGTINRAEYIRHHLWCQPDAGYIPHHLGFQPDLLWAVCIPTWYSTYNTDRSEGCPHASSSYSHVKSVRLVISSVLIKGIRTRTLVPPTPIHPTIGAIRHLEPGPNKGPDETHTTEVKKRQKRWCCNCYYSECSARVKSQCKACQQCYTLHTGNCLADAALQLEFRKNNYALGSGHTSTN